MTSEERDQPKRNHPLRRQWTFLPDTYPSLTTHHHLANELPAALAHAGSDYATPAMQRAAQAAWQQATLRDRLLWRLRSGGVALAWQGVTERIRGHQ